ncbi:hypothetical protein [Actinomadura kijaniata]|uniref:hypothetical protein n=1 Tax=Actinomadura kijaniata TaxID=46161 RepID=UPI000829B6FF|nr:hypothetical protein [Actinomadura kijaniata]
METPISTGPHTGRRTGRPGRRAALALAALAGAVPMLAGATAAAPPAVAEPGDNARFRQLNKQVDQLERSLGGDLAKLRDVQFDANRAIQRAKDLRAELDASRNLVAELAANQYMTGGGDPTIQVLTSGDPSNVLAAMSLSTHLAQNKSAKVQQIQQLVLDQEKAKQEADRKIQELEKEIADLRSQKRRIQSLMKKFKPQSPAFGLGGITPRMKQVKDELDRETGPFPQIGCVRTTGDPQDHARGMACDFMVTTGGQMATGAAQALGDRAAAYAIAHGRRLGINYVIWRQRIYSMHSPGWRSMSNRGGVTANHYDHVHISVY